MEARGRRCIGAAIGAWRVGYDGSESARRALQSAAAHAGDQTLLVVVPASEPYPRRGSRSQPTSTVLSSNGAGTTSMTRGRCCPSAGYEWRHCSCEVIRRPYPLATGRSLIHRGAALRPTQGQVHAQPEVVSRGAGCRQARGSDGGRTPWSRPCSSAMLWVCSEPDAKRASSKRPRRRYVSAAGVVQTTLSPERLPSWRRLATRRRSPAGSTKEAPSTSWIDTRPGASRAVSRSPGWPHQSLLHPSSEHGQMETPSERTALPPPSSD